MPTPILETLNKDAAVLWQQYEDGVPEPALIITEYSDVIEIKQDGRYINLNYDSVQKLCAYLKTLKPGK